MNGTEQRERQTAVARVEKRCEDVETVVMGLAQTIVTDREAVNRVQQELAAEANRVLDAQDARIAAVDGRLAAWESRTWRARLRWLFLGR